jgi:VanZ family protein
MAPGSLRSPAADDVRSSASVLAWVWLAVIVYASLFPFEGWRWPRGLGVVDALALPWPRYFIPFDIVSNLLGYLPLGLLVAVAILRRGGSAWRALLAGALAGALSAYALEVLQLMLAPRVPSLLDWLLNAAGAALGALLALVLRATGLLGLWQRWRGHLLERGNGGAMALLLLWPVALLFPAPMPLGLGQVGEVLRSALTELLLDVPWASPVAEALALDPARGSAVSGRFNVFAQHLAVATGLLAPGLLAFAASRKGWPRFWLVLGAGLTGALATTLSTLLNFGPDHAWAWLTLPTLAAMAVALALLLCLLWVGQRLAAGIGLIVLTVLVMLVNQAPTDPYFAQSLQDWEQGRFIRFHGAAQWLGWLWPYACMGWLLVRLGRVRSV